MKELLWIASTKRALMKLPKPVMKSFGYGLYQAQMGAYPDIAKTLKGFGAADVIELCEDDSSGTYRSIYTVRFSDVIIVLHVFQKKSKQGIKTPKEDIDLIRERLKRAEVAYHEWKAKEE